MARVTVEDCVDKVPNRFELVMLSAQRARAVAAGAPLTVERDNDKNPVVALREIAEETVEFENLRQSLVRGLQKQADFDEPEEDEVLELIEAESHLGGVDLGSPVDESSTTIEAVPEEPSIQFADAAPVKEGN